jgi:hypothetical protein
MMIRNIFTPRVLFVSGLIIVAAILRLLTTGLNFTPVAAMALFGGAYLGRKHLSYLIPLAVMFITDVIIGLHSTMIFVYVAFALTVTIGIGIRSKISFLSVIGGAIGSALLFFIITNFGTWITGMVGYPMTTTGLITCYAAGIPFLRNDLASTLLYSGVLFGAYAFARRHITALA